MYVVLGVIIIFRLGEEEWDQHNSMERKAKEKYERIRAGKGSDDSDKLLVKWRGVWGTLPRVEWEREWELLP